MIQQNICLVDFSDQVYQVNSLYTKALLRPQLNLLYLATALASRGNLVTVVCSQEQAFKDGSIQFLPHPEDPERFWGKALYDIVICLNSLQGSTDIRPYLPEQIPMILWSTLVSQHIAMLGLRHSQVQQAFRAFVVENHMFAQAYVDAFEIDASRTHYRWPGMIRTLRKRFSTIEELKKARNPHLTLLFCSDPLIGLAPTLDIYRRLKVDYPELVLKILLKPGFEWQQSPVALQNLIQEAKQTPGVEVHDPMPWPAFAEALLGCHVLCSPLAFNEPYWAELIDPLSAGCQAVLCRHSDLQLVSVPEIHWIEPEPADSYFERYIAAIKKLLDQCQTETDKFFEVSLEQIANFNTLYTWDLRVWEWESLFFRYTREPAFITTTESVESL